MDQLQPESGLPAAALPSEEAAPSPPSGPTREERLAARYPNDPPKDAPAAPVKDGEKPTAEQQPQSDTAYSLKAPEGFQLDAGMMEIASPTFRDLGLNNDQAQKLVPLAVKFQERLFEQQNDNFRTLKTDWAKQAKADPEIGGKNWKSTVSLAQAALKAAGIGDKHAFRDLLDDSGLC
jgi:hypothetical protein